MITMLIFTLASNENSRIERIAKKSIPFECNEAWDIFTCDTMQKIEQFMETQTTLDILCIDISYAGTIDLIENFRKKFSKTLILLIANEKMSPLSYLKPSIRASSLILKPYNEMQLTKALTELFSYLYLGPKKSTECFVVESKDEMIRLEYSTILLFEAREKKVFAFNGKQEYGFYSTLDTLESKLPDYFVRCHRSFLCNFNRVKELKMNSNLIILDDNSRVPLSRSYRNIVRSRFYESRVNTEGICN